MFYYNQRNYANVPYNKPDGTKTTVAKGGCGVCSALMVLNNLYGKEVMNVSQMAKFSIDCGARTNNGTEMSTLLTALAKKYTIKYKATELNKELLAHLKAGGMAIINQGDVYNVFSTAGHFVVGYKLANDNTVIVLDPDMYDGKYDRPPRPDRIVKKVGNEIYVKIDQISKATQDRNPCYWLVSFTGKKNKPSIKAGQSFKLKKRAKLYNTASAKSGVKILQDFTNWGLNEQAVLKVGAKLTAGKVLTDTGKNIWVYLEKYKGWICIYDYKPDKSKV